MSAVSTYNKLWRYGGYLKVSRVTLPSLLMLSRGVPTREGQTFGHSD